jgi:hypothetical protein
VKAGGARFQGIATLAGSRDVSALVCSNRITDTAFLATLATRQEHVALSAGANVATTTTGARLGRARTRAIDALKVVATGRTLATQAISIDTGVGPYRVARGTGSACYATVLCGWEINAFPNLCGAARTDASIAIVSRRGVEQEGAPTKN